MDEWIDKWTDEQMDEWYVTEWNALYGTKVAG